MHSRAVTVIKTADNGEPSSALQAQYTTMDANFEFLFTGIAGTNAAGWNQEIVGEIGLPSGRVNPQMIGYQVVEGLVPLSDMLDNHAVVTAQGDFNIVSTSHPLAKSKNPSTTSRSATMISYSKVLDTAAPGVSLGLQYALWTGESNLREEDRRVYVDRTLRTTSNNSYSFAAGDTIRIEVVMGWKPTSTGICKLGGITIQIWRNDTLLVSAGVFSDNTSGMNNGGTWTAIGPVTTGWEIAASVPNREVADHHALVENTGVAFFPYRALHSISPSGVCVEDLDNVFSTATSYNIMMYMHRLLTEIEALQMTSLQALAATDQTLAAADESILTSLAQTVSNVNTLTSSQAQDRADITSLDSRVEALEQSEGGSGYDTDSLYVRG